MAEIIDFDKMRRERDKVKVLSDYLSSYPDDFIQDRDDQRDDEDFDSDS
jgi:hypothetical protein